MIRIFVGCASGDDIESQAVLEYTLRKHASQPLDIIWMQQSRDPQSPFYVGGGGWATQTWSTPFSGFRWAIPELCNFEGQAIYMDSDMIVMDDIAKLWAQEFQPGKIILSRTWPRNRFCVVKWDCAAAKAHLQPIADFRTDPAAHRCFVLQFRSPDHVQQFADNWNCIDGEEYESLLDPQIKIIHYSAENMQPHLRHAIPRLAAAGRTHWFDGTVKPHWRQDVVELFDRMLEDAIAAGYLPEHYAPTEPFGKYRIKSHADYGGNRWSRKHSRKIDADATKRSE